MHSLRNSTLCVGQTNPSPSGVFGGAALPPAAAACMELWGATHMHNGTCMGLWEAMHNPCLGAAIPTRPYRPHRPYRPYRPNRPYSLPCPMGAAAVAAAAAAARQARGPPLFRRRLAARALSELQGNVEGL